MFGNFLKDKCKYCVTIRFDYMGTWLAEKTLPLGLTISTVIITQPETVGRYTSLLRFLVIRLINVRRPKSRQSINEAGV